MKHRTLMIFLIILLVVMPLLTSQTAKAQNNIPQQQARTVFLRMTPEERVGQLFLVTFKGSAINSNSQIYDLIVNHHVGGVVLLAVNDNFVAEPDTVAEAYQLIADLQRAEFEGSSKAVDINGQSVSFVPFPLLVGISQLGGGAPADQILSGLSPIPSEMALGASWNADLAEKTGALVGRELSALGFNMYFGPSLDVLSATGSGLGVDAGTSAFGGDPYWVGKMGQAYIYGLHAGSDNRMAVVSKHFPGRGEADRPIDTEVATVRKSLEQLKQIELAPFFAVTGNAPDAESVTDALLVSHIRYQGFQGNIRATTRPISFDPQALGQIMSLPEFVNWRDQGGVIVSDDLGSQAVRQFYDPTGLGFLARIAARDALLAGNDLLYMGNAISSDAADNYNTIISTLDFFVQKYKEDPTFTQRVDEAALRVLTLKYQLYPQTDLQSIIPAEVRINNVGNDRTVALTVAFSSATLINPDLKELLSILTLKPSRSDYLLFITDVRQGAQCSTCPPFSPLPVNTFKDEVLQLYGASYGGEIQSNRVSSYSFTDLAAYFDDRDPPLEMDNELRRANWIIISAQDLSVQRAETQTLKRLLSEKQELIQGKRVILFAFGAPYYLDATDISKISAYYGIYSRSRESVNVAARLLFQEIAPTGALPVSVPGIGYDLISITSPNPDQVIDLYLDLPQATPIAATGTPPPTPIPLFRPGDAIAVRTSVILDHNGHPVPDGTPVRITLAIVESGIVQEENPVTINGVAQASFRLEKTGLMEIRAQSEPATTSVVLLLDVSDQGAAITVVAPTEIATETPSPTPMLTPEPSPTPRSILINEGYPNLGGWFVSIFVILLGALIAYWLGAEFLSQRWGVRWAFCVLIGGLIAYNVIVIGFANATEMINERGINALIQIILLGEVGGGVFGVVWSQLASKRNEQAQ